MSERQARGMECREAQDGVAGPMVPSRQSSLAIEERRCDNCSIPGFYSRDDSYETVLSLAGVFVARERL